MFLLKNFKSKPKVNLQWKINSSILSSFKITINIKDDTGCRRKVMAKELGNTREEYQN